MDAGEIVQLCPPHPAARGTVWQQLPPVAITDPNAWGRLDAPGSTSGYGT